MLHVHTVFSLLDGMCQPKALARRARELGLETCAVTDHGHMGGVVETYQALRKEGVGAVVGMETVGHHILLARNLDGYRALMSTATDLELPADVGGLVVLTGCVRAPVPSALRAGKSDLARSRLRGLISRFGRDNVRVELQATADPHLSLNPALAELAAGEGVKCVLTNDVHYLDPDDAEAQNILMAMRQRTCDGFRHPAPVYYLRDLRGLGWDWAWDESLALARECASLVLPLGKHYLPKFADDEDGLLASRAREGLVALGKTSQEYRQRLDYELDVIRGQGFSGYFLIVAEFVAWARGNGVAVGPGRGSGAGSLVAWALGITGLDPLAHGLLFERFLNPERVSLPDFDVDFCQEGRDRVIDHVREKYGRENVAQIATYMALSPKSAIKDVARIMGMSFAKVNEHTSQIPAILKAATEDEEAMSPWDLAMARAPAMARDPEMSRVLDIARRLMGCCRQLGLHAGGVVIGQRPVSHYSPLTRDGTTQYDMNSVEAAGLVKFDFLGLKTLDVIAQAQGDLDMSRLPLDDKGVYDDLASGDTWGVFQLESGGMTRVCRQMRPKKFHDLSDLVALFRPGPKESGMLDSYLRARRGEEDVSYPHPLLEPVLKDTYGTMVYQEQVMEAVRVLAGYTMGGADKVRKAMGKKLRGEMDAQRLVFIRGCADRGIGEGLASKIFDDIAKFAGYSFNRSHSAGYAILSYQTAYLKRYRLPWFVAALMSRESDEALIRYFRQARNKGLRFLGPCVLDSGVHFQVAGPQTLRWSLSAIKGLGEASVRDVIDHRPYQDFFDLVAKTSLGRGSLARMIDAGCFDVWSPNRAAFLAALPRALDHRRRRQVPLFPPRLDADVGAWTGEEVWARESGVLGAYVTRHPARELLSHHMTVSRHGHGRQVTGVIVDIYESRTRDGDLWARLVLEDENKSCDVILWPSVYALDPGLIRLLRPLTVRGDWGEDGVFKAREYNAPKEDSACDN